MIKLFAPDQLVFDCEWVPDTATGRRVYGLPSILSDGEVRDEMFREAGADEDHPRPYLKTALCRIISIAAIRRVSSGGTVTFSRVSLPHIGQRKSEREIIHGFLTAIGRKQPQLVSFNGVSADLPALIQRAAVHRIAAPDFCRRPSKPWEGVDYFSKYSDWNVDLKDVLSNYSYGKSTPSLHEIAAACGIPAKQHGAGGDVLDLWLNGEMDGIVRYSQRDTLTTYLLWLRVAHLAGHLTTAALEAEEAQFEAWLRASPAEPHLIEFCDEWRPEIATERGSDERDTIQAVA